MDMYNAEEISISDGVEELLIEEVTFKTHHNVGILDNFTKDDSKEKDGIQIVGKSEDKNRMFAGYKGDRCINRGETCKCSSIVNRGIRDHNNKNRKKN